MRCPKSRGIVVCETLFVFLEFAESPIKIFKKCKIRTNQPHCPPSASYVVYSMLDM